MNHELYINLQEIINSKNTSTTDKIFAKALDQILTEIDDIKLKVMLY